MIASVVLFLASAFQILPFYQQDTARDYYALRPLWSHEGEVTDVLWPVFTKHRDWWRFCFLVDEQTHGDGSWQFEILPIWWNGREKDDSSYWGLFPLYGRHPHILMMYDWEFCLWPVWMRYRTPRPKENRWMTSNVVLFPFVHWRDDGSWGFWPFYTFAHNRADDHTSVLWPIWNWKTCFADRDTGGEGSAWMLWPLMGRVAREREDQWLFVPPLFSYAETRSRLSNGTNDVTTTRLRCPWPIFEYESSRQRTRLSVFPLYEHIENRAYADGATLDEITRFGWRLVELLPDETRVFPFWVSRPDDTYFRLWPLWESSVGEDGVRRGRFLSLFPIRWAPSVDRNWSKFWTLYENATRPGGVTEHSLFWGIVRWTTHDDEEVQD